jgi:hypothetical protein
MIALVWVRTIAAVGLSVVSLGWTAAAAAASDPTPEAALADLNAMRAEAGVPAVDSLRADWNQGCAQHNRYEAHAGGLSHQEDHGSSYYTPEGEDAAQNSVLAGGQSLPRAAWVDAVYHRSGLLQPRLRVSGFDASSGNTCMRIYGGVDDSPAARTPVLTLYPWPPDGATGQPTEFTGGESPSPEQDVGGSHLGFLLSVAVNGPWEQSTSPASDVVNASLTADDGTSVRLGISDRDSTFGSAYLDGGFGLFPLDPLRPGTHYTAHADGVVDAEGTSYPFSYDWHFMTARRPSGGGTGTGGGGGSQSLKLRSAHVRSGRKLVLLYFAASKGRISVRLSRGPATYVSGTVRVGAGRGTVTLPTPGPGRYLLSAKLTTSKVTRLKRGVRVTP